MNIFAISLLTLFVLFGCSAPPAQEQKREYVGSDKRYVTILSAPPTANSNTTKLIIEKVSFQAPRQQSDDALTKHELKSLSEQVSNALKNQSVPFSIFVDYTEGIVHLEAGLYKSEAENLTSFSGVLKDPNIRIEFNSIPIPKDALSNDVSALIRVFPRAKYRAIVHSDVSYTGVIVLRDGCFFIEDNLLVFPEEAGLTIDDEGHIVIVDRSSPYGKKARIGEHVVWRGSAWFLNDKSITVPLYEHCGRHPILAIGTPSPTGKLGHSRNDIPTK